MGGLNMKAIGKGFVSVLVLMLISILVVAVVLFFTSITEEHLPRMAFIIQVLSVLLGSTIAAKIAGCKGLLHGLSVALLLVLLLMFLNFIWIQNPCQWLNWLKTAGIMGLAGVIGGMIGVGLSGQG